MTREGGAGAETNAPIMGLWGLGALGARPRTDAGAGVRARKPGSLPQAQPAAGGRPDGREADRRVDADESCRKRPQLRTLRTSFRRTGRVQPVEVVVPAGRRERTSPKTTDCDRAVAARTGRSSTRTVYDRRSVTPVAIDATDRSEGCSARRDGVRATDRGVSRRASSVDGRWAEWKRDCVRSADPVPDLARADSCEAPGFSSRQLPEWLIVVTVPARPVNPHRTAVFDRTRLLTVLCSSISQWRRLP